MPSKELLATAARYRAIGMSLPPNLAGPQGRAYYFAMAEKLEREAMPPPPQDAPKSPPQAAPPKQDVTPQATKQQQISVHSRLALAVLRDKRTHMHRAFALWVTLRADNKTWHKLSDVITATAAETGTNPRTIKRWLDAGQNIFWATGRNRQGDKTIWLRGKDKVFATYKLTTPGRVLNIPRDRLLGSLQQLRATLQACWLNKQARWASRDTLKGVTGVSGQTQLNYERHNGQRKQSVWALDTRTEYGDVRQLPNKYQAVFYPKHNDKVNNRYKLYTPEINGTGSTGNRVGDNGLIQRVFFDNCNRAVEAAEKRAKAGQWGNVFALADYTKKNNILVRTIGYHPSNA